MYRSLLGTAPLYLVNSCTPTADVSGRQHLRLPVSGSWSFRVIVWTVSVVGVLLSRARQPGIRYLAVFATQHWVSTCLGVSWRHTFCEILTRCTQRIRDRLIMRYVNLHFTYLLTYALHYKATSSSFHFSAFYLVCQKHCLPGRIVERTAIRLLHIRCTDNDRLAK